jgi:hypothetical protein
MWGLADFLLGAIAGVASAPIIFLISRLLFSPNIRYLDVMGARSDHALNGVPRLRVKNVGRRDIIDNRIHIRLRVESQIKPKARYTYYAVKRSYEIPILPRGKTRWLKLEWTDQQDRLAFEGRYGESISNILDVPYELNAYLIVYWLGIDRFTGILKVFESEAFPLNQLHGRRVRPLSRVREKPRRVSAS